MFFSSFLFLFVIDEECATMVTEPLQHEQPVQPQHQSKTMTHHVGSHQTVPLIGLTGLVKTVSLKKTMMAKKTMVMMMKTVPMKKTMMRLKKKMKMDLLGSRSSLLKLDDVLTALYICAARDETAAKAVAQLPRLRGCELHSTQLLRSGDESTLRKLGLNVTCEPVFPDKQLFF